MAKKKTKSPAPRKKTGKRRAAPKATLREKVVFVAQREVIDKRTKESRQITQKELAKILGVSDRTLRRWKAGETKPDAANLRKLDRAYRKDAEEAKKFQRRERRKHKAPALAKPIRASRRMLKERRYDPRAGRNVPTGNVYPSDWINYDVRGWNLREIHGVLVQLWKKAPDGHFQFIYFVPKGARYPSSDPRKPGKIMRHSLRTATAPVPFYTIESEEELLTLLLRYIPEEPNARTVQMLYLGVNVNGGDEE